MRELLLSYFRGLLSGMPKRSYFHLFNTDKYSSNLAIMSLFYCTYLLINK